MSEPVLCLECGDIRSFAADVMRKKETFKTRRERVKDSSLQIRRFNIGYNETYERNYNVEETAQVQKLRL